MRTSEQWLQYERLELLTDPPKPARRRPALVRSWLRALGQWANSLFVNTHEPQIWKIEHSNGREYWKVHDPVTRHTTTLSSEAEVRMWIDQRYYS